MIEVKKPLYIVSASKNIPETELENYLKIKIGEIYLAHGIKLSKLKVIIKK